MHTHFFLFYVYPYIDLSIYGYMNHLNRNGSRRAVALVIHLKSKDEQVDGKGSPESDRVGRGAWVP